MAKFRVIEEYIFDAPEDLALIEAIAGCRHHYHLTDSASLGTLLRRFSQPEPMIRDWLLDLCGRDLVVQHCLNSVRRNLWVETTRTKPTGIEDQFLRRVDRFAADPHRVIMGAGRPQDADYALIFWAIRSIEEALGRPFRFARPAGDYQPDGPMLRLVEAALHRLFAQPFVLAQERISRATVQPWQRRYDEYKRYGRETIARVATLMRTEAFRKQMKDLDLGLPLEPRAIPADRGAIRLAFALAKKDKPSN